MPARAGGRVGSVAATVRLRGLIASLCATLTAAAGASASSMTPAPVSSARALQHALVTRGGPPRPTTATCRAATPAERRAAPFGRTRRPVYSCLITLTGERARYDVQVLRNGCYVAERHRRGRAVYGCGA